MKLFYTSPQVSEELQLPELAYLRAASGQIQDYVEIPDTWD